MFQESGVLGPRPETAARGTPLVFAAHSGGFERCLQLSRLLTLPVVLFLAALVPQIGLSQTAIENNKSAIAPIGGNTVRFAYLIPSNRAPQAEAEANLRYVVGLIHEWFRDQMQRDGFGSRSFRYEADSNSWQVKIHVVHLSETDEFLRGSLWNRVSAAAGSAGVPIWSPGEIWVLFPETHLQLDDGSFLGGVSLGMSGGGSGSDPGLAMVGSTKLALLSGNGMLDETPYDGQVVPDMGPFPLVRNVSFPWFEGSTFGSVASCFAGSVAHELTHALGMPHDFRNDSNARGNLMGNGLRGMRGALYPDLFPTTECRLAYTHALALNSSRYFMWTSPIFSIPEPAKSLVDFLKDHPPERRDSVPAVRMLGGVDTCADGQQYSSENPRDFTKSTLPTLTVETSGQVDPVSGQVEIEFTATGSRELASVRLVRGGNAMAEMPLTGLSVDATIRTSFYDPDQANTYRLVVHDEDGERTSQDTTITPNSALNQGSRPFFRVTPSRLDSGEIVQMDASASSDPDGDSGALLFEWDVDGDGLFEHGPNPDPTLTVQLVEAGLYHCRVRITDSAGSQVISTRISIDVGYSIFADGFEQADAAAWSRLVP